MFNVKTPSRKHCIKSLARRSYKSLASTVLSSQHSLKPLLLEVSRKIRREMRVLSSDAHDSVLRDSVEAVKRFSWDTVFLEYEKMVPTLLTLLKNLIPRSTLKKPLLCLVVSMILKSRHQRMGLVQKVVSVMMFGNGSSKQVRLNIYLAKQYNILYAILRSFTTIFIL